MANRLFLGFVPGRRGQVVRQRFAKPPFTGSNPVGASNISRPSLRRGAFFVVPRDSPLSEPYFLGFFGSAEAKITSEFE